MITVINVPAGGNAELICEVGVNDFAPPAEGGAITNTVTVTVNGVTEPIVAEETVIAEEEARLQITKALAPTVVTEDGKLTYTFTIQNFGNQPVVAADDAVHTDIFYPVLDLISVTCNEVTGLVATESGRTTAPTATYTQAADGTWTVTPGVDTLMVTGTV